MSRSVVWLQGITAFWMLAEAGISLYASFEARSPVLLAFGADSGIELLSARVVLLAAISPGRLSERRASLLAGYLLFLLAAVIAAASILAIVKRMRPATSWIGIGITIAAPKCTLQVLIANPLAGVRAAYGPLADHQGIQHRLQRHEADAAPIIDDMTIASITAP